MDVALAFMKLFQGRDDAWGAVHGECKEEPVLKSHWQNHLHSHGSLGIYPLMPWVAGKHPLTPWPNGELMVRWGCTDIDQGYDLIALAANVHNVLRVLGISSWVERTKGKGYHVWVFSSSWIEASIMRNALLFAHQVADVPPREVNPKQVSLEGLKGYGNYVNLPYARDWVLQGKRVMLDMTRADRCPLSLDEFLAQAKTNGPEALEAVAKRYVPPAPLKPVSLSEYSGALIPLEKRMSGLVYTIWTLGPRPDDTGHVDRSWQAYRFACLLKKSDFTPGEALRLLSVFDMRWLQKFSERHDGLQQLQRMIERAFG